MMGFLTLDEVPDRLALAASSLVEIQLTTPWASFALEVHIEDWAVAKTVRSWAHSLRRTNQLDHPPLTGTILLGRLPANKYGLLAAPETRRAIVSDRPAVVAFNCTTAIEAHLAIRSLVAMLVPAPLAFMHGASFLLQDTSHARSLLVAGSSGSGKSHLLGSCLARPDLRVVLLNEDWSPAATGPCSVADLGESLVLLKTESANLYARGHATPQHRDPTDPTRALYSRDTLFGSRPRGQDAHRLDAIVFLRAETQAVSNLRPFDSTDLTWIRNGEDSLYYGCAEQLLDGSTEVLSADRIDRRLEFIRTLSRDTRTYVLDNSRSADMDTVIDAILADS
jgi:hypothetical protein